MNTGLTIGILAFITFVTRMAGVILMDYVRLSPFVARFLKALSGSVLVALVVPQLINGDLAMQLGSVLSLGMMIWRRNMVLSLFFGLICVALFRLVL